MAQVELQAVVDSLPADGTMVPYDAWLRERQNALGPSAARSILAAKKKGHTKTELVVQADGSKTLYIGRRAGNEPKSSVTLSEETRAGMERSLRAATSVSKKAGA